MPDQQLSHRIDLTTRLVGAELLVLLAVTWPLWTCARELPTLPAAQVLLQVPAWVDVVLLAGLVSAAVRVLASGRRPLLVLLVLTSTMLLDQLRWQAWAIHAWLVCLVLCGGTPRAQLGVLRALTIAVYAYSAISKFDHTFATTLGQQFLLTLAGPFAETLAAVDGDTRATLAMLFPAFELGAAVLLAVPRLRVWGLAAAVAMHLSLAMVFAPWGVNHSWGVIAWNLFFAANTALLFAPGKWIDGLPRAAPAPPARWPWLPLVAAVVLGAVLPAAGMLSWWDVWPSWALYAAGRERADATLAAQHVDNLPDSLQQLIGTGNDNEQRIVVPLDTWCLQQTGAPLYPGTRVPAALAFWLADRQGYSTELRVVVQSTANRRTGERTTQTLSSISELRRQLATYRLNTTAR